MKCKRKMKCFYYNSVNFRTKKVLNELHTPECIPKIALFMRLLHRLGQMNGALPSSGILLLLQQIKTITEIHTGQRQKMSDYDVPSSN